MKINRKGLLWGSFKAGISVEIPADASPRGIEPLLPG